MNFVACPRRSGSLVAVAAIVLALGGCAESAREAGNRLTADSSRSSMEKSQREFADMSRGTCGIDGREERTA